MWDKLDGGTKKWGDNLRRSSKCSFLTGCHRTLPQAVSKAWAPQKGHADEETSEERADDDIHIKKKKRKNKAVRLWKNPKTPSVFMAAGISSKPIRLLLSKMFAAEKEARISSTLQETREGTLLGEFVADDGFIEKADQELEALLEDTSPLLKRMCLQVGEEQASVKRNRGMLLRLQASFRWRILRRTRRQTGYVAFVRAVHSGKDTKSFCKEFMRPARKDCCYEPYFERRTKRLFARVDNGAELAMAPSAPFRKALKWSANAPPLFMICARETDHASLSNKLKTGRAWSQGLIHPAHNQMLEKIPRHAAFEDWSDREDTSHRRDQAQSVQRTSDAQHDPVHCEGCGQGCGAESEGASTASEEVWAVYILAEYARPPGQASSW